MQTGQRIGTSVGIAVVTAALFATLDVSNWGTAVATGFGLIVLVVLAALAVAIKDQADGGAARCGRRAQGAGAPGRWCNPRCGSPAVVARGGGPRWLSRGDRVVVQERAPVTDFAPRHERR